MGCYEELGNKQWLTYECVGKGKEDVWTYDSKMLRDSLEEAIKKMGIKLSEINRFIRRSNKKNGNKIIRNKSSYISIYSLKHK